MWLFIKCCWSFINAFCSSPKLELSSWKLLQAQPELSLKDRNRAQNSCGWDLLESCWRRVASSGYWMYWKLESAGLNSSLINYRGQTIRGRGCCWTTWLLGQLVLMDIAYVLPGWAAPLPGLSCAHTRSGPCGHVWALKSNPQSSGHIRQQLLWAGSWGEDGVGDGNAPGSASSTCPKGSFATLHTPGGFVCR